MKAVLRQFGWLLLAVFHAVAQTTPATLRDVKVTQTDKGVQVDVSLSSPVQPTVLVTHSPERLVLDFPNTTASAKQQRIEVNQNGIRAVRYGLNSSRPAITRVVIDLDRARPYQVHNNGTTVALTVAQPVSTQARRVVPPAAASGGLMEIFRHRETSSPRAPDPDQALKRPLPWTKTNGSTTTASTAPSAAHPNLGSLQQGTVYPGMGNPETGTVPANSAAGSSTAQQNATSLAAAAPKPSVVVQPAQAPANTPKETIAAAPGIESLPLLANHATPFVTTVVAPPSQSVPPAQTSAAPAPFTNPSTNEPSVEAKNQPPSIAPPVAVAPTSAPPSAANTGQTETAAAPPIQLNTTPAPPAATTEAATQEEAQAVLDPNLKTVFRVKYVADGVAYLDGGRSSGLAEGMKLEIRNGDTPFRQGMTADPADPRVAAELQVTGLADTSAVTDIHTPQRPVKVGDLAYLSTGDAQAIIAQKTMSPTRSYPMVVAFSEGDPMDEEVRKELPRPPQPSVNRARGRIGFDYMGTISHDTPGSTNTDLGMIVRTDVTRIGGTFWNLSGYWRGRLHSRSGASQPTLQDLINRTYHLGMFYDNPDARWVAGVGRLYLPWAPSLDTIDGGYFGVKLSRGATTGFFAGSTPDPSSWSYNPDRRMAGAFINFQGGEYDAFHYTSTSGLGLSALKWQVDRPFVFLENTLSYKRYMSIYDSAQADSPRGNAAVAAPGAGLSRNFLTVRLQVHPRVELDFNHNYLRDIPTYDPTLVGTGLLDKYLFQGASAGARVEVLKQVFVYTNLGSSNRSGDAKHSLNQLYGLTFARLPWWGIRADAHYSRFSSAFADGSYRSISLGRNVTDDLRFDVLVGDQNYTSTLAASDRTRFLNTNAEFSIGPRYFMQGGFTVNRGQTQNYDQWLFTLGYRFDSKARHK